MPKVSVIIPIYGVEKYIERCARSLFEQTLDDIEYLFVNDCTPDKSIVILKQVLQDYPRRIHQVRIIDMRVNSGQAEVRKTGMLAATGDYVIHCDSDDWVNSDMYKNMYQRAIDGNFDIVRCNFSRVFDDKYILCKQIPTNDYNDKFKVISWTLIGSSMTSLCDKLVKRELLDNLIYPTMNMQEDMALVIQLLYYSDNICFIPQSFYHYYCNPASITGNTGIDSCILRYKEVCANTNLIIQFLVNKGISELFPDEIVCLKSNARNHLLDLVGDIKFYKIWKNTYPEINKWIIFNKKMRLYNRLISIAAYLKIYPILHWLKIF